MLADTALLLFIVPVAFATVFANIMLPWGGLLCLLVVDLLLVVWSLDRLLPFYNGYSTTVLAASGSILLLGAFLVAVGWVFLCGPTFSSLVLLSFALLFPLLVCECISINNVSLRRALCLLFAGVILGVSFLDKSLPFCHYYCTTIAVASAGSFRYPATVHWVYSVDLDL